MVGLTVVLTFAFALVPTLVPTIVSSGPLASSGASAQQSINVVIPDIDPLAIAANAALEQLRLDSLRLDRPNVLSASYLDLRFAAAELIATRLDVDASELDQAWGAADLNHQTALLAALTQVGVPYKRFAMKPGIGFDCSGLTSFAWSQAGFDLPRNSTRQIRVADPRTLETAQAGDLLRYPGHVMMWLGVGQVVIHSPEPRQFVEVKIINNRSMKRSAFGDPTV